MIIYRYDGSTWHALTGCAIDTTANTITCPTSNFSMFALFGTAIVTSSGTSGGSLNNSSYVNPRIPAIGFKILINKGAAITSNNKVTLTFNAGSDVSRVAISNSLDFSKSSLEIYSDNKLWDLCDQSKDCLMGSKTVYAKFYTQHGRPSEVVSAVIAYEPSFTEPLKSKISPSVKLKVFIKDLQLGDIHDLVKLLQKFLNTNGFALRKAGPGSPGNETNNFGLLTEAALIKFQVSKNISPADGRLRSSTRTTIEKTLLTTKTASQQVSNKLNEIKFNRDLKKDMSGKDVRLLQEMLITANTGAASQALAKNKPSGYFGSLTAAALVEFQKSKNITPANGYFGLKTRTALIQ